MSSSRRIAQLVMGALLFGWLLPLSALADKSVPPELALKVMLRVLTYDAAFSQHGAGEFTVAVAYPSGAENGRDAALRAAGTLAEKTIQGRALKFVPVEFNSATSLVEAAKKAGAAAILAPAGLGARDYTVIANAARSMKAYGLSLVPEGSEAGVLLGVANNGGRPQLLLHREASQEIGANWPPSVLKLARLL